MCGECVLALQAAAQDLDGGGLVVSGAQVAQARRGRASDCGAAAQERWGRARAAAQWRARARRRLGVASRRRVSGGGGIAQEWRRRSGVRARVQGRRFREEEETTV